MKLPWRNLGQEPPEPLPYQRVLLMRGLRAELRDCDDLLRYAKHINPDYIGGMWWLYESELLATLPEQGEK